ncbi:DUF6438 domain-containing protein [Sphingobacterium sp. SYP-B4668]|uniref:DUF6438 domain-containing protein n=1 Tax=Sphingobacterium sp. SYP-B4668 TaxID=2996035 RepID=UPI0022DE0CA6|nr:DUF6438 domain-containing protein [Sphingobacterium sp. SYP-B4668]
MKYLGLVIACFLLFSCKNYKNVKGDSVHEISAVTMSRTPCFGFCPIYTLSIEKDGKATLDAKNHLKNKLQGKYIASVSPKELHTVFKMLQDMKFSSLEDSYGSRNVTDLPSVNTAVVYEGGASKKINDYGNRGTPELSTFYAHMDELLYRLKWEPLK